MKLSFDQIEEIVDRARAYTKRSPHGDVTFGQVIEYAQALVQIANACVVGLPCERHAGVVHGKEAEELRSGIEQILCNTADVDDEDASHVLREMRKSLTFLIDHIDARDSLAFAEAKTSSPNASAIEPTT